MPNEEDTAITRSQISNGTSQEEIGEFWDEHNKADYWDRTYGVEFKINPGSKWAIYYGINVTLAEQIRDVAKRRGISAEQLLNLWIQEKLREEIGGENFWQRLSSILQSLQLAVRYNGMVMNNNYK